MDWCRVLSRPDVAGVEVLRARFLKHRYARHAHDHAVIGLVDEGVQSYLYRGERHRTGPGGIFVVDPDQAHTGEADDAEGYAYRALYPTQVWLDEMMPDQARLGLRFREPVLYDAQLSWRLRQAHLAFEGGAAGATCEGLLLQALATLLRRNGASRLTPSPMRPERAAVRRVRAFLEEEPAADVSLAALSRLAGLSPFHLAHAFARDVGAPVHVYVEAVRVRRAKQLLRTDLPLAQIGLELGYADQSHFCRRFKQQQGVSPGRYRLSARSDKTRAASGAKV